MAADDSIELIGNEVNSAVVRLTGRRFPGIVIQGDSLNVLCQQCEAALGALREGRTTDGVEDLREILALLVNYRRAYEDVLARAGIALPYPSPR